MCGAQTGVFEKVPWRLGGLGVAVLLGESSDRCYRWS